MYSDTRQGRNSGKPFFWPKCYIAFGRAGTIQDFGWNEPKDYQEEDQIV